jgi:HlyD family secretion protein
VSDKRSQLQNLRIARAETPAASRTPFYLALALGAAIGALVGGAGGYFFFSQDEEAPAIATAERAPPVPALAPSATPAARQVLSASGYVTARRKATVSAEVTGRITEILIEEGMTVAAGEVVARLDSTMAEAELKLAEAQAAAARARVESAAAELAEARRVLTRSEALAQREFASKAAVTSAQARMESAAALVAQTRAEAEVARQEVARRRENLDKYQVRTPFAGVVVEKNAQPGEIISPISAGGGFTRTGICTVVDMDSLEIEVDVNESFIGRVMAGQAVEASLDAYPDWRIPASVIAIVPTADRTKATVKVRIGFLASDARILPDMGVKVTFLDEMRDAAPAGTASVNP